MEFDFSRNIFEKFSNTKFDENPFIENWVIPCNHRGREKNMTKLDFLQFTNLMHTFFIL